MQMSEKSSKISKDPKCMWKNPLKSHLFCCAWSLFISSWLSSQSCKHWDLCFAKVLCPKQLATLLQVWLKLLKLPKLSLIQDVPWCRRSRLQRKDVTAKATIPVHVPKKDLIRKCRSQNNPLAFMDRNFESTHNPKNYTWISWMACYCYLRLVETLEGLKILLFHEVGCDFSFKQESHEQLNEQQMLCSSSSNNFSILNATLHVFDLDSLACQGTWRWSAGRRACCQNRASSKSARHRQATTHSTLASDSNTLQKSRNFYLQASIEAE